MVRNFFTEIERTFQAQAGLLQDMDGLAKNFPGAVFPDCTDCTTQEPNCSGQKRKPEIESKS
jgi:hypothetical protein